jgi:hypothetical protein
MSDLCHHNRLAPGREYIYQGQGFFVRRPNANGLFSITPERSVYTYFDGKTLTITEKPPWQRLREARTL